MPTPYHPPVKRSIAIAGHKTSISLEPVFWDALRAAAEAAGVDLFINARTDVFFQGKGAPPAAELMGEALERAAAYREAGASGVFVPGLGDLDLIGRMAAEQDLPLNVMRMGDTVSVETYAQAGVARISHGPGPYLAAMKAVGEAALS